jgi:hypothetical protein
MSQPPYGGTSAKPPLVLAAGILLIVSGVLGVIFAITAFQVAAISAIINLIVSAAAIWAGWMIIQLQEQGRVLGLILAAVGAIFAVILLIQGVTFSIISLLLNGFVIFVLVTQSEHFRR